MARWTLADIPWQDFEAGKTTPELVAVVKASALVEYNGHAYGDYLCRLFADDPELRAGMRQWAQEEVQHGATLAKWAALADPAFDFEAAFSRFINGYDPFRDAKQSVRGSRSGELVARCVVETGTSSYYTAMRHYTDEPVLQAICLRIAADEFRHYKFFYTHLKRYLKKERIGLLERLRIALSRIAESEDDELCYAFYAANIAPAGASYNHTQCKHAYIQGAYRFYRPRDTDKMVAMVLKTVGFSPGGRLTPVFNAVAWNALKFQAKRAALQA